MQSIRLIALFMGLCSVQACTFQVTEKMILQKFTYPYKKAYYTETIARDSSLSQTTKSTYKLLLDNTLDKNRQVIFTSDSLQIGRAYFKPNDSTTLEYLEFSPVAPQRTLFYFMGNLENVFSMYPELMQLASRARAKVYCVHYRGYGYSTGQISLKTQFIDNQAFYKFIQANITGKPAVVGYSLGSVYAVPFALDNSIDALYLLSPFSNTKQTLKLFKQKNMKGAKRLVAPFVRLKPESHLATISNTKRITGFTGRLVVMHDQDDDQLPFIMGQTVYQSCPSADKTFVTIPSGSHTAAFAPQNWAKLIALIR